MPTKNTSKLHRMVIEVNAQQYARLRGHLLATKNQTVSDWVRQMIDNELREPVKGQFRTAYGRALH
jgi:hypothetical protein